MQSVIRSASRGGNAKQGMMKSLFDQGLITEQEYLNSRQTEMNIEQQITEVKQQILVLNENYQTATQVVATASGRIMEIPVRHGDYVQPAARLRLLSLVLTRQQSVRLFIFRLSRARKSSLA